MMAKQVIFIGLSGYHYPHTRVRCYHFQREIARRKGVQSSVLSYRDHLAPEHSEAEMYRLSDRQKLRLTRTALRTLWKEKGSLFYIQKAHFHSAAPFFLHRLGRNPYVFDYDDYDVELSNFFSRGVWNRLFFGSHQWDVITERMARQALFCVAASHELIDYLQPLNPKVYYIPTGVDCEVFLPKSYAPKPGPVVFLWTGIVWGPPILKSVQMLLDAFREVFRAEPNVQLRIIGGGDCYEDLRSRIRSVYAELPVEVLDWMAPGDMPAQLRLVDVGCLPLDAETANRWVRSKSPTKMFEFMASGLPVVASNVGEPRHVIENSQSGFLVANRQEMAQQMIQLAQHPALRESIGTAARIRVEQNFSLPVLGEHLYTILKEHGWVKTP